MLYEKELKVHRVKQNPCMHTSKTTIMSSAHLQNPWNITEAGPSRQFMGLNIFITKQEE